MEQRDGAGIVLKAPLHHLAIVKLRDVKSCCN